MSVLIGYYVNDGYSKPEAHSFFDDKEKMLDFFQLSKEEFLKSYSYLTEEEYNATAHDVWERAYKLLRGAYGAL